MSLKHRLGSGLGALVVAAGLSLGVAQPAGATATSSQLTSNKPISFASPTSDVVGSVSDGLIVASGAQCALGAGGGTLTGGVAGVGAGAAAASALALATGPAGWAIGGAAAAGALGGGGTGAALFCFD